eukprot:4382073-Pyramimonas_sp.AAC.3
MLRSYSGCKGLEVLWFLGNVYSHWALRDRGSVLAGRSGAFEERGIGSGDSSRRGCRGGRSGGGGAGTGCRGAAVPPAGGARGCQVGGGEDKRGTPGVHTALTELVCPSLQWALHAWCLNFDYAE